MTRRALTASFLALALAGAATPALAQRDGSPVVVDKRLKPTPLAQLSNGERAALESQNAWSTQQDLWRVMRQYPPAVGEIIQRGRIYPLDPTTSAGPVPPRLPLTQSIARAQMH